MNRWLLALAAALVLAGPALADWDPEDPAKWVQFPDLSPEGLDVNASPWPEPYVLADDFECTETGPITGIHIWGSWFMDEWPPLEPQPVTFHLAIFSDIPASQGPHGHSVPGEPLWAHTFEPGTYTARIEADGLEEGWFSPPEEFVFPGDTVCWQYNFEIPDIGSAFVQQGTPDEPVVYWLVVKAEPAEDAWTFGWKTSPDHWNDAAVWTTVPQATPPDWRELRYPAQHPLAGERMDLAFVIQSEEQPTLDYGDAPDPDYPTLQASNGAAHRQTGLRLGSQWDAEIDGQPDAGALGDDAHGLDDEDGVTFTTVLRPNCTATVAVTASAPCLLDAWVDFDDDGDWTDNHDQICASQPLTAGLNHITFSVPPGAAEDVTTYARFRASTAGGLAPTGVAVDGEVEDYTVRIEDRYVLKWRQAPDLSPLGIDVAAGPSPQTPDYVLADDFLCTETGPLTDVRIWGSWLEDVLPLDGPDQVVFHLAIHADIPADESETGYSMPGEVLWDRVFEPGDFAVAVEMEGIEEGWLDPPDEYRFPADWTCWRYDFHVDPHLAFRQLGTPDEPVVYWLEVKAMVLDEHARFGWKTSIEHWNDDAVWGEGPSPGMGPWFELRYPPPHELAGESIDLAFALMEDTVTEVEDDGPPAPRMGELRVAPNPFNPRVEISYALPTGGPVRLAVFDVRGRLVRVLVDREQPAGPRREVWNGRSSAGRDLPAGTYLITLEAPGVRATRSVSLVR